MKPRIALPLFILFLACPLSGFGQSTLNFPRLFAVVDLPNTGFAITNPGSTAATVTFTLINATGGSVGSANRVILARQQFSETGNQIFPNANTAGWIRATSTSTGLQGFWLGGDFAGFNFMDGADAAPGVAQELVFPLATASTEINIANLATTTGSSGSVQNITNTFTIRLLGSNGIEQFPPVVISNVAPNGIYKNTLVNIFPSANFTSAVYVRVTGSGAMTGTSVTTDFIHAPSWSVVNGVDPGTPATEVNFPHVPSGPETGAPKWTSQLGITNFSASSQALTITYNRSVGSPVTVTRNLAGRGVLRESVKDMFSFGAAPEDGWVRVSGTGPLGGFIAYGFDATSAVAVVPVQTTPRTTMIFSHVANSPFWGTGLALLNTSSTDANVEVFIMRRTGALVGGAQNVLTAAFTLPGGTKRARLLTELVPTANADDGFVYVRSVNNVPLYGLQLFFTSSIRMIANVAAGVIDPTITFTPPPPAAPLPPLTITTVTPSPVSPGQTLTITGAGFSATPTENTVGFTAATGSTGVQSVTAAANTLTVNVPPNAITGPVYVTSTGGRFSNSVILSVTANSTTLITSNVTVSPNQNTAADIYVPPPVVAINGYALAITDTNATQTNSIGASSVEASAGTTRRLWIVGDGITSVTNVGISGSGITISPSGVSIGGGSIVHITIAANASLGPRNIVLTNSTLDTSIITGGLIIR